MDQLCLSGNEPDGFVEDTGGNPCHFFVFYLLAVVDEENGGFCFPILCADLFTSRNLQERLMVFRENSK